MSSKTTTSFPTVGDSVLSYVGSGGAAKRSGYTIEMPVKTMGRGSSPTGTTGNKSGKMIHEANGPKCTITGTLYSANAAEASATQRNVKIMPSATGSGDFWRARVKAGQQY